MRSSLGTASLDSQTSGCHSDMSLLESCHRDMLCFQPVLTCDVTVVVRGVGQLGELPLEGCIILQFHNVDFQAVSTQRNKFVNCFLSSA